MEINLSEGKYTYIFEEGKQYALRHGEPWRDLTGDNFVYWMACLIQELQKKIEVLEARNK